MLTAEEAAAMLVSTFSVFAALSLPHLLVMALERLVAVAHALVTCGVAVITHRPVISAGCSVCLCRGTVRVCGALVSADPLPRGSRRLVRLTGRLMRGGDDAEESAALFVGSEVVLDLVKHPAPIG
jgi:hypothetical protein